MDNMEDYYMAEENLWGAERGAFVSPVSLSLQSSLAFLPGLVPGFGVGVGLLVLFLCCFPFSGKFVSISTNSSCWPTMSRTSPAMRGKKNACRISLISGLLNEDLICWVGSWNCRGYSVIGICFRISLVDANSFVLVSWYFDIWNLFSLEFVFHWCYIWM